MLHCCLTLPFLARNLIFVPLYILWGFLPSVLLLRFCYNCFELCDCDRSWCRVFFCVCVCLYLLHWGFVELLLFVQLYFSSCLENLGLLFLQLSDSPSPTWLLGTLFTYILGVWSSTAYCCSSHFFFSFFCYVLEFTNLLFAEYILLLTPLSVFFTSNIMFLTFLDIYLGLPVFSVSLLWTYGIQLSNCFHVLVS